MKQDADLETLVRQRIRGLRVARGWSLDELAGRCLISPSTLSRIETGHRRIALDQMATIARALGATLDQLVESDADDDVVIRPHCDKKRGITTWLLSRDSNQTVAKMRVTRKVPEDLRVHPGRDWFTVLSGTIELRLPWGLLQVTDPSSRQVLRGVNGSDPAHVTTDGFRFVLRVLDTHGASAAPRASLPQQGAAFWTWQPWEEPRWYAERKPAFGTMRETFRAIPDAGPAARDP